MSEIAFIKQFLSESHKSWGEAVEGLTSEQAHWRPYDSGNHIAFNLWHYTRTVDNIILFLFQRKPNRMDGRQMGREVQYGFERPGDGHGD